MGEPVEPILTAIERRSWTRLACLVLATLPSGRVLHVGAEDPALVEELVARGIDAVGFQRMPAAGPAGRAPDRFVHGDLHDAAFAARSFATVLWSLAAEDDLEAAVRRLLPALSRLCDRHAVLLLHRRHERPVTREMEGRIRGLMFDAGFRLHPAQFQFRAYDEQLADAHLLALAFERMPQDRAVLERRSCDFLLDADVAADDVSVRYAIAAQTIRRQDVVMTLGGGAGAGAAMLYDNSLCARLLAADERPEAVAYARRLYGVHRPRLEFHEGGAELMAAASDHSIDVIVAIDTEWVAGREDVFYEQAVRLLVPGGRLVVAFSGCSPERTPGSGALERLRRVLHIERVFAQVVAAPGLSGPETRSLILLDSMDQAWPGDAACAVVVAVREPLRHDAPRPERIAHPRTQSPSLDIALMSAGYANPWIPYGLLGTSIASRHLLIELAIRTLDDHPDYSADRGAALCVLAYRRLEGQQTPALRDLPLETWLDAFVSTPPHTPLEIRWCISNSYVLARLHLQAGRLADAERLFARCAACEELAHGALFTSDLAYITLTATKTVDAAFWAGWLAAGRQDRQEAHRLWTLGVRAARRAVIDGWDKFTGPRATSTPYALKEASEILAAAARCEQGLAWLDLDDDRVGDLPTMALDASGPDSDYRPPVLHVSPGARRQRTAPAVPIPPPPRRDVHLARLLIRSAQGRPLYLWGAGALGRRFAELAGPCFARVTGFIDRDAQKQDTSFVGKPVYAPAVAEHPEAERPFVVITSAFADEIEPVLQRWGYNFPDDAFVFPC
jgi:SAM-dependent methyltransferase